MFWEATRIELCMYKKKKKNQLRRKKVHLKNGMGKGFCLRNYVPFSSPLTILINYNERWKTLQLININTSYAILNIRVKKLLSALALDYKDSYISCVTFILTFVRNDRTRWRIAFMKWQWNHYFVSDDVYIFAFT